MTSNSFQVTDLWGVNDTQHTRPVHTCEIKVMDIHIASKITALSLHPSSLLPIYAPEQILVCCHYIICIF